MSDVNETFTYVTPGRECGSYLRMQTAAKETVRYAANREAGRVGGKRNQDAPDAARNRNAREHHGTIRRYRIEHESGDDTRRYVNSRRYR